MTPPTLAFIQRNNSKLVLATITLGVGVSFLWCFDSVTVPSPSTMPAKYAFSTSSNGVTSYPFCKKIAFAR